MKKYVKIKIFAADKVQCNIYAGIESLIKEINGCANNPEQFSNNKNK